MKKGSYRQAEILSRYCFRDKHIEENSIGVSKKRRRLYNQYSYKTSRVKLKLPNTLFAIIDHEFTGRGVSSGCVDLIFFLSALLY